MRGRPRIYTEEELAERHKMYQKNWYEKNKQKIKDKYDPEKSKTLRENKIKKGYYIIYNDELLQQYIGYSKSIDSRISTIFSGITSQDTKLHRKFDPSVKWKWRVLCFVNEKNHDLLKKCEYKQMNYSFLNDKILIS
jgi:ribosomal protein S17E